MFRAVRPCVVLISENADILSSMPGYCHGINGNNKAAQSSNDIRHRFCNPYAYQRFSLSQGCGRQRGSTDAATITVAVLIGASGTSAANAPLLKQGNLRDGSTCPALSEMFRNVSCFFFSAVVSLIAILSYEKFSGFANAV